MGKYDKLFLSFIIAVTLLLVAIVNVNAAPINGLKQTVIQPDGTEIELYFYGDEIYNYMTDLEGYIIVQHPETGYYVYASLEDDEITYSTNICGNSSLIESIGGDVSSFITKDRIPDSAYTEAYLNSRFTANSEFEAMSLDYEEKDFNGMEINNIVVFIRFSDTTYTKKAQSYYDGLFNTDDDAMKRYFEEVSYGKLLIDSTFYPRGSSSILTYKDIHNASYYNATNYEYDWEKQRDREQAMFKRALNYVKEQIPEDLDVDKNNDGAVDMITFVLPGDVVSGENQVRWPHQSAFISEYETTINGATTDLYAVQIENALRGVTASDGSETAQNGSAILCHEAMHIIGFPDMYYYNYSYSKSNQALGEWDIMCYSNGAHTPAYMKYTYGGWLDIPEVKENGRYTLTNLADREACAYKIRSPYSANEYFVVEYRHSGGKFETNIPKSGVVIYRVLADNHTNGNCNATSSTGKDDELRYLTCKTSGSYSPKLSSGSTSGISLTGISVSETTASFTVSFDDRKYLTYFRDENLANAIISAIGKTSSQITDVDLQTLTSLSISGSIYKQNYDLSGIEQLTGLTTLCIEDCGIDDISSLAYLRNLETLILNNNRITNINPLSNLTKLKTLKLRGNYIDDYSPVSSFYNNLITKDFSLNDTGDALFYVPNILNGTIGTAYLRLSNTRGETLYYSLEKYDALTGELLSRKRDDVYVKKTDALQAVTVPDNICDDINTYVILRVYENDTYRHLMSETIIDNISFDLTNLNEGDQK